MPDELDRELIFAVHVRGKPFASGVDLKELALKTEGFSGADIASVVKKAALRAVRRAVEAGRVGQGEVGSLVIETHDLDAASEEVRR
jgi:transitional endoplasmic reticulum ATPase